MVTSSEFRVSSGAAVVIGIVCPREVIEDSTDELASCMSMVGVAELTGVLLISAAIGRAKRSAVRAIDRAILSCNECSVLQKYSNER